MFKKGINLQGKNGKIRLIWVGYLVFLLALGFTISWPGQATAKPSQQEPGLHTVTLEPVYDIWITQASPDTTYRTDQSLLVGADEFTQEQQALMLFNLSSIPTGVTIQTARLEAYLEASGGLPFAICVDQITSGWGTAVTWNTRPSTNGACQSPTVVGPTTGVYYTWNNLSGLVQTWVQTPSTNSGLLLKQQPGANANHDKLFASVRQATHRPRLVIAYTLPGTPTPTVPPPGSIQGIVWTDTNRNGVQDGGEPGLNDVQLLLQQDGVVLTTKTTNTAGEYRFDSLTEGSYTVEVDPWSLPLDYVLVSGTEPWMGDVFAGIIEEVNFGYHSSPRGTFNVQIQAVEVTQGVRGDIPTRTPPDGSAWLSDDYLFRTHITNRRTIVRVYPWVSVEPGSDPVPPLSASLIGYREPTGELLPGSPLAPVNPGLITDPDWDLTELREEAGKTWNFVLPDSWLNGQIRLRIQANPSGPAHVNECEGCSGDNTVTLTGVRFQPTGPVAFHTYVTTWPEFSLGEEPRWARPTFFETLDTFTYLWKTWPISIDDLSFPLRLAVGCVPGTRVVGAIGVDGICDDPLVDGASSPQAMARRERDSLGISPGDPILFPQLLPPSARGCSGHAGVPSRDYWSGACGPVFTHESTHAGPGRNHAGDFHGSVGAVDPSYPHHPPGDRHGKVEANTYGFDISRMQVIPPEAGGEHTHDVMSYGNPKWVSIYTWDAVATWLRIPRDTSSGLASAMVKETLNVQASTAYLRLSGYIDHDGPSRLDTAFYVNIPDEAGDHQGQGHYILKLQDASGQTVFERRFEPVVDNQHHTEEIYFIEDVPIFSNLAQVTLYHDNDLLATRSVLPNTPRINLINPTAGDQWEANGTVVVAWEVNDADGESLGYLVEASPDDGETWRIIGSSTDNTQTEVDLSTIPGSGQGWRVRVQASDGLNVGLAEVDQIDIAPKPPQVLLFQPSDGATFAPGQEITLLGKGFDWQDNQLKDNQFEWIIDNQVTASGHRAVISGLSEGEHVIRLRATNSSNLIGEMEVTITVAVDSDYDGLPDDWEIQYGLDPLKPDASYNSDSDYLVNWQEFEHNTNPLLSDTDGDGYTDADEVAHGSDPTDQVSVPPKPERPNKIYLPIIVK